MRIVWQIIVIYLAKSNPISFLSKKRWYAHVVFRRRRRSRRWSRIGGASTKNSSMLSATRGRRRHDWQQVEIWAICHRRRPAIPAITSSASTAAGSSIGPPRSGTFRFASVCMTRSRRKHREQDVRKKIAATPLSLSAKKKDLVLPDKLASLFLSALFPSSLSRRFTSITFSSVLYARRDSFYFEIFACFTSNVETISQKVRLGWKTHF